MSDDTVFFPVNPKGGNRNVFHTDENCHFLAKAHRYREIDREVLFDDVEECSACAGGYSNNPSGTGRGHLESLRAAASNEEGSA